MNERSSGWARDARDAVPESVRVLLCVRVLNQIGAYTLPFLAVLAGSTLAPTVLTVFGVAALISRWLGAWLLERLEPRLVVAVGLAATGLALAVLAISSGTPGTLAAVALVGLAFEIYEPATYEAFARSATGPARQRVYVLLSTSLVAASAVAGLTMAILLPLGVRWLIWADAATCLVAAVLALRYIKRDRPAPPLRPIKRWRPPAKLIGLTATATAFASGYLAVIMFAPLLILQRGAAPWVPGVVFALSAVAAPLLPHLLDRFRAGRGPSSIGMRAGSLVLAALVVAMAELPGVIGFAVAYIGWAAISATLLGQWSSRVADCAPEAERQKWFAFHGMSWAVAQPVVSLLTGLLGMRFGGSGNAALTIAAVAFVIGALGLRKKGRQLRGLTSRLWLRP